VVKPQETEEELKTKIFDSYSKLGKQLSSNRRQVYFGQFCEAVFSWCKKYPFNLW